MATSILAAPQGLHDEITKIERVLADNGETERSELARLAGARFRGPGVFRRALHEALRDGAVERRSRRTFGPAGSRG